MKIKFNFSKLFDNDKFVKIFSLVLGIIVWFIASVTVNPVVKKMVEDIPINFDLSKTVPEQYALSIVEGQDQLVNIKVEGSKYKISQLTADDFVAVPNLTKITKPGEYEIDVIVSKINEKDPDYKIISSSPKVKVSFDRIIEKEFKLVAIAENVLADQDYVREEPIATPEKITLKGPSSEIDKIAKCVVVSDEKITSDKTEIVEGNLEFYDENNNRLKLKKVTYQNEKYEITVPIQKHKVVPLTVDFINIPVGFDVKKLNYTLSKQTIEISGPKDVVNECESISLGTIDMRLADVGSKFTFDIKLLAGIKNVEGINTVDVVIEPEGLDSKVFNIPSTNIIIQNQPTSYNINIKSYNVNNVKVVGTKEDIAKLAANDLIAVVNCSLFEITDGTSRVPVTIYSTGNKYVWAVGEYTVLINAKKTN